MKIGPIAIEPSALPGSPERKPMPAAEPPAARPQAAGPSAEVVLSPAAKALSAAAAEPAFDTAKVERISEAIREGRFKIDAEAIADKLISNAAEILGRRER
jgi:negative regulator of flagellin synthesis FlgM